GAEPLMFSFIVMLAKQLYIPVVGPVEDIKDCPHQRDRAYQCIQPGIQEHFYDHFSASAVIAHRVDQHTREYERDQIAQKRKQAENRVKPETDTGARDLKF